MLTKSQIQGLHKVIVNLQLGAQRKLKCLKEQQKIVIMKTVLMLLVPMVQNCFSIQFNQSA